jgi:Na+-translocating ferredoxin:NAD+ oxidoreductase RnfG subunit
LFSRLIICVFALTALFNGSTDAEAKVFYSRNEALELAFPDADEVASETFVLDEQQADRIQSLAKCPLESKLVKIYKAVRAGSVIGYALIDIHNVRTLPEAFMVVLTPSGEVSSLRVLAFHEPLEYKPTSRWYDQFDHKSKDAPLRVGSDVHGVVGATLSARATTRGVRRALAFYEVLIQNEL